MGNKSTKKTSRSKCNELLYFLQVLLTLCSHTQLQCSHSLWLHNHLFEHHCVLKNEAKHTFSFQNEKDTTNDNRDNQKEKHIASFQHTIEKLSD